jgi:hypothetical protein
MNKKTGIIIGVLLTIIGIISLFGAILNPYNEEIGFDIWFIAGACLIPLVLLFVGLRMIYVYYKKPLL